MTDRKVVINACHGGFSLSPEGEEAYLARQRKSAFFYMEDRDSADRPGERDYVRVPPDEARSGLITTTLTADIGARVTHDVIWPKGQGHEAYWYNRDLKRDDPDLVAVVETLGDAASGRFAKLRVVEIPGDVEWEIEEYDGLEWVAEKHRTWQ